MTRRSCAEVRR